MTKQITSVEFEKEVLDRLRKLAEKSDMSVSAVIRTACKYFLGKKEPK